MAYLLILFLRKQGLYSWKCKDSTWEIADDGFSVQVKDQQVPRASPNSQVLAILVEAHCRWQLRRQEGGLDQMGDVLSKGIQESQVHGDNMGGNSDARLFVPFSLFFSQKKTPNRPIPQLESSPSRSSH